MHKDWKAINKRRKTKDLRLTLPPTLIDQMQRDANLASISLSEYVCRLAWHRAIKVRPDLAALDTLSVTRNTAVDSLKGALVEVQRLADLLKRTFEVDPRAKEPMKFIVAAVRESHNVLGKTQTRVSDDFKNIIEGISGSSDDEDPERAMVR
jgi:hypothetical protein